MIFVVPVFLGGILVSTWWVMVDQRSFAGDGAGNVVIQVTTG